MTNIAQKNKELNRQNSLYWRAAKRFGTSYDYCFKLASGMRNGTRGKGKQIKEWMELQLQGEENN